MSRVLVIDDEPSICWSFEQALLDLGHEVTSAATAESALSLLSNYQPDVILLDFRLPGMDGLTTLRRLHTSQAQTPVILMTAFGSLNLAVDAIEEGAFDYLPKPFDLDDAVEIVCRAINSRSATIVPEGKPVQRDELLVGTSRSMQEVFRQIAIVAPQNVPVLICGERGVGKETVARAIHRFSERSPNPFVAVSLPTTNEATIDRELFGQMRDVANGKNNQQLGSLVQAHGGTLFLKDLAELPVSQQMKLLRIWEDPQRFPAMRTDPLPADFRLIAATQQSPEALLSSGLLCEELYLRLKIFRITIPPLRERIEDVSVLAERFLRRVAEQRSISIDVEAMDNLTRRAWRGNARELLSAIQHAVLICRGNLITPDCLPPEQAEQSQSFPRNDFTQLVDLLHHWAESKISAVELNNPATTLYEQFLDAFEPTIFTAALNAVNGNRKAAAELLGLHRETLRKRLKRHRIDDDIPTSS